MSFKSLLNEVDAGGLSRMAAEILLELDSWETKNGWIEAFDYSGDGVRRAGRSSHEAAYPGNGESFYSAIAPGIIALKDIKYSDDYLNGIDNRDNLDLSLQELRRRERGHAFGGDGESAGRERFSETLTAAQEFSQSSLPERLSERFCREARRYDGAFERF